MNSAYVMYAGLLLAAAQRSPMLKEMLIDEVFGKLAQTAAPNRGSTPPATLPDAAPTLHVISRLLLQLVQVLETCQCIVPLARSWACLLLEGCVAWSS